MIIVITESWLTTYNKYIFNITNYSSEHILINNKRGGGVSIFINNNIKYKLIDNLSLSVNDAYDMVTVVICYRLSLCSCLFGYDAKPHPLYVSLDDTYILVLETN